MKDANSAEVFLIAHAVIYLCVAFIWVAVLEARPSSVSTLFELLIRHQSRRKSNLSKRGCRGAVLSVWEGEMCDKATEGLLLRLLPGIKTRLWHFEASADQKKPNNNNRGAFVRQRERYPLSSPLCLIPPPFVCNPLVTLWAAAYSVQPCTIMFVRLLRGSDVPARAAVCVPWGFGAGSAISWYCW